MKKGTLVQFLIILFGIMIGGYFSNRAMILHQEIDKEGILINQKMNHGYLDVSKDSIIPGIEKIELIKDDMIGWNLLIKTTNFKFTPENVNTKYVEGKGHAHIYINGEKYARLYGPSFHISSYDKKIDSIRITLNANSHKALKINNKPIQKTIVVN